jgi:hypothetical protein
MSSRMIVCPVRPWPREGVHARPGRPSVRLCLGAAVWHPLTTALLFGGDVYLGMYSAAFRPNVLIITRTALGLRVPAVGGETVSEVRSKALPVWVILSESGESPASLRRFLDWRTPSRIESVGSAHRPVSAVLRRCRCHGCSPRIGESPTLLRLGRGSATFGHISPLRMISLAPLWSHHHFPTRGLSTSGGFFHPRPDASAAHQYAE